MTQKEIIKMLAKKYIENWRKDDETDDYDILSELQAQRFLLDDIFEELFNIKDLSVSDDGYLMSGNKRIEKCIEDKCEKCIFGEAKKNKSFMSTVPEQCSHCSENYDSLFIPEEENE